MVDFIYFKILSIKSKTHEIRKEKTRDILDKAKETRSQAQKLRVKITMRKGINIL